MYIRLITHNLIDPEGLIPPNTLLFTYLSYQVSNSVMFLGYFMNIMSRRKRDNLLPLAKGQLSHMLKSFGDVFNGQAPVMAQIMLP